MATNKRTSSIYQPSDPSLAPGEARCPGRTVQDTLRTDERVPEPLLVERYEFLGNEDISLARYTSEAIYQQEVSNMWSKTWQWACRVEQIPNVGDWYVYDVAHYSILVIRGEDEKIRAFVNSCPHRAMQFEDSATQGTGKQFIRCPFHGISFELDGAVRDIPCRWDFPHVDEDNFQLDQVGCDVWQGFVFVNPDVDAPPLNDYLEVLPEHFANWDLENRYIALHTEKILPGNWKMCMEGFMEAFHVLATHPEALATSSWANTQYDLLSPHVNRFVQTLASGNPQYERQYSEEELYAMLGYKDALESGKTARQQHAEKIRQNLGKELGKDLADVPDAILLDSIEYHLFPNACFFPGVSIPLIYRFRPLGVDKTIHDVLLLNPLPDSGERPAPAPVERLDIDEPYVSLESFKENRLSFVLDQDTENFKRQWAGILASQKGKATLANYQEARIRHFHQTLDRYLQNGET